MKITNNHRIISLYSTVFIIISLTTIYLPVWLNEIVGLEIKDIGVLFGLIGVLKVFSSTLITKNIRKFSNELSKLMKDLNFFSASFITAFNPYSQNLELQDNRSRNKVLELKIQAMQFHYLKGDGRCMDSKKVGEESFLVFGTSKMEAARLGEEFEQNAIVFCERDAIPDLLLLK